MKIKERAKKFVTEHEQEILRDLACVAAAAGAFCFGCVGFTLGRKFTYGELEHLLDVDLTQKYTYATTDAPLSYALQVIGHEQKLTDHLVKHGFDALDNPTKLTLIYQKK